MSSRASASMASDFPGYADVSGFLVIESRKISRKMATHNTEKRGREMNGVEIAIWAVVAFTLVYEPVFGYLDYRRFKRKAGTDDGARIRLYVRTMIGLWLPVLFSLGVVGLTDVTPAVMRYALALAYHGIGYRVSAAMRAKMDRLREERVGKAAFADMLPVTDRERKWWAAVSVTAGIAEEIIYRGFLFFAFSRLFPSLSVWG